MKIADFPVMFENLDSTMHAHDAQKQPKLRVNVMQQMQQFENGMSRELARKERTNDLHNNWAPLSPRELHKSHQHRET